MANLYGFQTNTIIHAAYWIYKPDPTLDPTGRETIVALPFQYLEATQPIILSPNVASVTYAGGVLTVTTPNNLKPGSVVLLVGFTNAFFLNTVLLTVASATSSQFTANYTQVANIVSTSISSNVLTVTCTSPHTPLTNLFSVGETVTLNGTAEAFLNGQTVTVLSTTLLESYGQAAFTAAFTHADYSNLSDTGTVTLTTYGPTAEPGGAQVIDPNTRTVWLFYAESNVSPSQAPRQLTGIVGSKFIYDMEALFQ
jgi:hypothetical protein